MTQLPSRMRGSGQVCETTGVSGFCPDAGQRLGARTKSAGTYNDDDGVVMRMPGVLSSVERTDPCWLLEGEP